MTMIIDPYRFGSSAPTGYDAVVLGLPGIWGYWKLDENPITGGVTVAVDASPFSRDGSYAGSGSYTIDPGLFASSSNSPRFDSGMSTRVDIPSITLGVNQKFTLGAFMKSTSSGAAAHGVIGGDDSGSNRRWQYRLFDGEMQFVTIDPSVTVTTATTSTNDGNPHLVIVVFDPTLSAGAGVVKHYTDGSLDGSSSTSITITNGMAFPAIGDRSSNATSVDLFDGNIDNAFICLDAITSTDVSNLWAARNSP